MKAQDIKAKYVKPSDLLAVLDSHGIYNRKVLDECAFDSSSVPVHSVEETVRSIEQRGLGGHLDAEPGDQLVNGWEIASALARANLGSPSPGDQFFGRGSSFRANRDALKEAGF